MKWFSLVGFSVPLICVTGVVVAACGQTRPPVEGSDPPQYGPTGGPCSPEGLTEACHMLVNEHDGVRNCFDGTHTCTAGTWTACGGSSVGLTSIRLSPGAQPATAPASVGNVSIKSLTDASSGVSGCTLDPCNPYCVGFDEDAGAITPDASFVGTGWNGVSALSGVPGGFINKGIADPCATQSDCNFDMYCDQTTFKCVFYAAGQKSTCVGPDITAGRPCGNGTFPVCNRGTVAVAAGTVIYSYVKNGGGNVFGTGCNASNGTAGCSVTVPAGGLQPGTCIQNPTCGNAGNVTIFVNSKSPGGAAASVAECTLQPGNQPGCVNNWTDIKGNGICVPTGVTSYAAQTYTQQYVATCPSGTKTQWASLAYVVQNQTSGGTSTSVKFEVQTAPLNTDGGTGTFGAYAQAALAPTDPSTCAIAGPTPCPKDLYATLGGLPAARNAVLNLQITLSPSTDAQVAPTLNSWQITYSCPPAE